MKKIIYTAILFGLILSPFAVMALEWGSGGGSSNETIKSYGTPATISISTSAWTKVPAATALSARAGFVVSLPASASANMVGHFGDCTSTAVATTVRPIELVKGNGFTFIPLRSDVCLWLLSIHTAAENMHVQEVTQ